MKAVMVKYEKTINLGNYESEKIGIEIALDEGESAATALTHARQFCSKQVVQQQAPQVQQTPVDNTGGWRG